MAIHATARSGDETIGAFFPVRAALVDTALRRYFSSGWAFLLPYLAAYLLYKWRHWPVNGYAAPEAGAGGEMPALLHVYWAVHVVHLMLAAITLVRLRHRRVAGSPEARHGSGIWRSIAQDYLPWVCLGLIFWVPGTYLEYPADTWEHFGRINRWSLFEDIAANPYWMKSTYFLAYSLVGKITPMAQRLFALDLYGTAICLLLCWQYYQLARSCGLRKAPAQIFVILQALFMGNNLFGFYRYYWLSSTVFAQLGAVALMRLTVDAVTINSDPRPGFDHRLWAARATAALGLLLLMGFTHIQGVGIAVLGVLGILMWAAASRGPRNCVMLAGAFVILNIGFYLYWPRHPLVEQIARPQGWLSAWDGFNFLTPSAPAFDRLWQILGFFGGANLIAALYLLRRNHLIAWLTLMPIVALLCPVVTLPFINQLFTAGQVLLVFHRMLFAVPIGLALVAALSAETGGFRSPPWLAHTLAIFLLALLVTVPASGPFYNRTFNAFVRPPADLATLPPELPMLLSSGAGPGANHATISLMAPGRADFTYATLGYPVTGLPSRMMDAVQPAAVLTEKFLNDWYVASDQRTVVIPDYHVLFTPYSATGLQSGIWPYTGHWGPQHVAAAYAGTPELLAYADLHTSGGIRTAEARFFPQVTTLAAFTAYGEVRLGVAPGKETAWFGFALDPAVRSFIELAGRTATGRLAVVLRTGPDGQVLQTTALVSNAVRLWMKNNSAVELGVKPSGGNNLVLADLRSGISLPDAAGRTRPLVPPRSIVRDLSISTDHAPGGLVMHIPLVPAQAYVVELRGRSGRIIPSLRLSGNQFHPDAQRYLSVQAPGIRFTIRTSGTLELLLYQDQPFCYVLDELVVRPAEADDLIGIPDGFDEMVPEVRYQLPADQFRIGN